MPSPTKPKQPQGAGDSRPNGRDKNRDKKRKKKFSWGWLGWFFLIMLLIVCIAGGAALGWASAVLKDLPDLNPELLMNPPMASTIFDRDGNELAKLASDENYREVVPFSDIPKSLRDALVASEDHSFYEHIGVDIFGIGRMLLSGGSQGGGSTITQQLARNVFLTLDVTYERKLREMVLALRLEQIYTKDEILHFYLNQVFWGHHANGVQAAAELYFGKHVKDLSLSESAMLVALLPSPNAYSPYNNYSKAVEMRNLVLDLMVEYDKISRAEAEEAKQQELVLANNDIQDVQRGISSSSFFLDFVMKNLPELLSDHYGSREEAMNKLYTDGLQIHTTLDPVLQSQVETGIQTHIDNEINISGRTAWSAISEKSGTYDRQVAAVVMAPETGEVVAMVGGRDYPQDASSVWNRSVDSYRQPGSAIKPLINYAPALQKRVITAATVFDDVPTAWPGATGSWHPTNFDNLYCGLIGIREALARSQNIPAIKTLQALGVDNGVDFLRKAGFEGVTDEEYLSAAIGGMAQGVSVLEMTAAYAAFMNNGIYTHPVYVTEVRDRTGRAIYTNEPRRELLLDEATNYIMLDLLRSVVTLPYGTGRLGNFDWSRQIAAKSGTTDDFNDLWFCGGTVDYASAVWIGHDELTEMYDLYGTGIAPKMWSEYMKAAHEGVDYRTWSQPSGITSVSICSVSGKRPSNICGATGKVQNELFLTGTEPGVNDICTTHIQVKVDITNNKIASPSTPAALTETRTFIKRSKSWYPLPYGGAPTDAALEAPTEYSENIGNGTIPGSTGNQTPSTPGGTSTQPSGTSTSPSNTRPGSTTGSTYQPSGNTTTPPSSNQPSGNRPDTTPSGTTNTPGNTPGGTSTDPNPGNSGNPTTNRPDTTTGSGLDDPKRPAGWATQRDEESSVASIPAASDPDEEIIVVVDEESEETDGGS